MRPGSSVGIVVIIMCILALIAGVWIQTARLHNTRAEYSAREANRSSYNASNYTVAGELYAVKPDGTEVVQDTNGRLWEIEGLTVSTHDKLLLEVKNNDTVVNVWTLVLTRSLDN
jgi:hypothetical protein